MNETQLITVKIIPHDQVISLTDIRVEQEIKPNKSGSNYRYELIPEIERMYS